MSAPGHVVEVPRVRVSGHSVAGEVYPDLVDGRVENDSTGAVSRQAVIATSRASRRSHSLLPENAAMVRRARMNMSRRRRGFTAVVLGEAQGDTHDLAAAFGHDAPQPPSAKAPPSLTQRRASAHKLLSVTMSDPLVPQGKQCVSCIGHPEYCLTALGLHDACPAHSSLLKTAATPRRAHSLRTHAYRMSSSNSSNLTRKSSSRSVKVKGDKIAEEGEASTPTGKKKEKSSDTATAPLAKPLEKPPTGASPSRNSVTRKAKKEMENEGVRRKESATEGVGDKHGAKTIIGDKESEANVEKMMDSLRRVSI